MAFSGDSLPFSYVAPNNQPDGYSIDLCKRVIAGIARAIGIADLKINWIVDTVPNRIAMVASGTADLECANTTASQSRMKDVDFSNLIFVDGGGFLIRADSKINGVADFASKSIAVTSGTTTEQRLTAMLKDKLIDAKIVRVKDGVEGTAMLESGAVAGFASDKIKLIGLAAQAKDPEGIRAARRGSFVRAVCLHGTAQRLGVPAGSEQGADANLPFRRDRADIHEMDGEAGQAERPARRHVRA